MFAKCFNTDCGAPFDYREGHLIRYCRARSKGASCARQVSVEHFWLCGKCSESYTFEYEPDLSLKRRNRAEQMEHHPVHDFASAA
jgi:hypothetical protein